MPQPPLDDDPIAELRGKIAYLEDAVADLYEVVTEHIENSRRHLDGTAK